MTNVVYALGYRTWADGVKVGYAFSPERIAVRLRDDRTLAQVVLVDPVRSHLKRLVPERPAAPRFSVDPTRRHLQPRRWQRGEPTERAEAVKVQRRLDARLRGLVDSRDTVLVTSHPVLAAVAERAAWRDVAFYAWDDYRGVPGSAGLVQWAYDQITAREVNVVAVTPAIVEIVGARRSTVVPNGIVAADFEPPGTVPEWYDALPGPVAFYAGSLQRRIDVAALLQLADDLPPEWRLVLVGPLQEPECFAALAERSNVLIRPAEPRRQVLAMMAAATVCLVPHLPETEGMSPLKVYEYLGAGAPVVATDLGPMRGLSSHCRLVAPGQRLAPEVLAAAGQPRATRSEVLAFRNEHDWDHRYLAWRAAVVGA
ncbi:glycosyltransferase [Nocardioides campestrisoli]|uniref:glycosyltransferase n=1 Tax=Nocardioides campestrisoli TaxID=2736757 RepID=UPI00163DA1A0|nr:glycosyltransferase [Nocardioides campestrisoli]